MLDQFKKGWKRTGDISNKFYFQQKTKARLNANMQAVFTMFQKHLFSSTYRQAHTQTHTQMKRNPEFFIGPSQPRRETSWGSEFGWVPGRQRKGVLHAEAPDQWSLVWSPVARVGLKVRGGTRVVNGRGPRRGVRVALSFLVEGQRHVRPLNDLLLNPRDRKNPFVTAKKTPKNSALREC